MNEHDHPSDPDACCCDAAAYALGALEPEEAERFQDHLKACLVCCDEVEALTAAAALALIVAGTLSGLHLATAGPGSRVIQARVSGSAGRAEVRIAQDRAELIVRGLKPAPPGQVYEVWLKAPDRAPEPTSVLFEVTNSGDASVGVPRSVRGASEVLVTPEPDGGSLQPTHSPVIVATLT